MSEFIYPLATVVLDFFCVLFCIRLSVSRRGPVWLVPMVLSLVLFLGSVVCLIATASDLAGETLTSVASYLSLFLFALTVVWLITIIAFAFKTKPDRFLSDLKKSENESIYLNRRTKDVYRTKVDRRATAKKEIHRVDDRARKQKAALEAMQRAAAQKREPYDAGPVATVSARKTGF